MLGVETDSVVGVRVAVVLAEGASFLLQPPTKMQSVDKVNIDFFIRNRLMLVVNKKYQTIN
jgi:hypothetical protein